MGGHAVLAGLAGKQRELQQRDELYLEVARDLFLREGYHSLTISRLAKATGFSRPTLYERFHSKEELLAELGLRGQRELLGSIRKAAAFPGRPRERMVAIGEVVRHRATRYADDLHISNFSVSEAVLDKVSPDLQRQHAELDKQNFDLVMSVVEDGERQGDLTFHSGMSAQALTLAFVALIDGLALTVHGAVPVEEWKVTDPFAVLAASGHALMDGCGWRPLSDEWDYEAVRARIAATLIAEMERDGGCSV